MTDDLAPFYAEFGDLATRDNPAATFRLIVDQPGEDEFGIATRRVTARAPAASGLEEGQIITVSSTAYRVASPPVPSQDGLEVFVTLSIIHVQ